MVIRELDKEEYYKLDNHPGLGGAAIPVEAAKVIVAENENGIKGFGCLVIAMHFEPIWVDYEYRKTPVASRIWNKAKDILDQYQIKGALSGTNIPEVEGYLERIGFISLPHKYYLYISDKDRK